MNPVRLHATPLAGLTLIEAGSVSDARGRFTRVFCEDELHALQPGLHFPQINLSATRTRGSVRGLHFQHPPASEAKLIRCLRGRVFDVAVDLRAGSPTFLRWHAVELDAEGPLQVFIPAGFAHGFQALSDEVELLYLHTARWSRAHEGGLHPADPRLGIAWPLPLSNLSARDAGAAPLGADFAGITP
ncbi:dTDP-4-dehydrorhamnose 3,5-epimerase family protein [Tahibacter harae]|uniref:dTDP-4-dehydrorhamnose 3,5-epimerase n=1 Tax=Tahibacter harae TaxID=2963937 RepID=A0ABT1QQ51_9GAMM|nr:dTDP-4-dehydrorhamnose 3,5-epimerase family protein [Tahibacter harae]MCQ4164409.1 dTDP-4-dehydrorhamnose 3,5-epimerase family protein [Tahibacter harae]